VLGMRPNGMRQLVVPPQLAWGSAGNPPVPPNANIAFVVTYLKKFLIRVGISDYVDSAKAQIPRVTVNLEESPSIAL